MKEHVLNYKWTVSRGRDTYGYRICTLLVDGRRVARCDGGGYDMRGTVLGEWLEREFADRIRRIPKAKYGTCGFYGLHFDAYDAAGNYVSSSNLPDRKHRTPHLNGACGIDCMRRVGEAIGLEFKRIDEKTELVTDKRAKA